MGELPFTPINRSRLPVVPIIILSIYIISIIIICVHIISTIMIYCRRSIIVDDGVKLFGPIGETRIIIKIMLVKSRIGTQFGISFVKVGIDFVERSF